LADKRHQTVDRAIDIICPVFREEQVIQSFHARLAAVADSIADRYRVRILYVIDPSADQTEAMLAKISAVDPRVEVLVMSRRFGHQAAIIAGIDRADADAVIMLDSDLQHPPELIPTLISFWEDGVDVVQTLRRDGAETALTKRFMSRLFYRTLFGISSIELRTGAADYRLLSRRVASVFREQIREHNPFIRGLVSWIGFKTVYVPFEPSRRELGKSKYRLSTLLHFALSGICSFSNAPLRLCTVLGFAVALLGLLSMFAQLGIYLFSSRDVPGWASLFAISSLIGGVQLLFLGILGEYVSLIFDEVKNRPRYLIEREYGRHRALGPEGASSAPTNVLASAREWP
jgi:glycosyltransferase involved in cell wall biosynthesis